MELLGTVNAASMNCAIVGIRMDRNLGSQLLRRNWNLGCAEKCPAPWKFSPLSLRNLSNDLTFIEPGAHVIFCGIPDRDTEPREIRMRNLSRQSDGWKRIGAIRVNCFLSPQAHRTGNRQIGLRKSEREGFQS